MDVETVQPIMLSTSSAPTASTGSSQAAQQLQITSNQLISQILTTAAAPSSSHVATSASSSASSAASSTVAAPVSLLHSASSSATLPSSSHQTAPPPPTVMPASSSSSSSSAVAHQLQQQPTQSNNNNSPMEEVQQRAFVPRELMPSAGLKKKLCSDEDEPEAKCRKQDHQRGGPVGSIKEKLEQRLNGILCCAVCLELPKMAIYQCQMGHLMCAACFTRLLADGRLRDQTATCPNCRVEISKSTATRNLAVENAVSELPSVCQYCDKEFPSKSLEHHATHECEDRPTNCKYVCIGCPWKGPVHEAQQHEKECLHPQKSGAEVMVSLQAHHAQLAEEKQLYAYLVDLLSYEKILFNDLQMKPYRTDEYVQKLFYETARFTAFNHQWAVKARINNMQRDPHQSNDRQLTYQLILKSKATTPLNISFMTLKGPFSDTKMYTKIHKHDFTDAENTSEYQIFPVPDSAECNRLLAAKAINFRLIMFMISK